MSHLTVFDIVHMVNMSSSIAFPVHHFEYSRYEFVRKINIKIAQSDNVISILPCSILIGMVLNTPTQQDLREFPEAVQKIVMYRYSSHQLLRSHTSRCSIENSLYRSDQVGHRECQIQQCLHQVHSERKH